IQAGRDLDLDRQLLAWREASVEDALLDHPRHLIGQLLALAQPRPRLDAGVAIERRRWFHSLDGGPDRSAARPLPNHLRVIYHTYSLEARARTFSGAGLDAVNPTRALTESGPRASARRLW